MPASEIAALKSILSGDLNVNPYPDHPVGPGDEWTKEGKAVVKSAPEGTHKLTGKYVDAVQYEGHPCARVSITMELTTDVGGLPVQATVTGKVKHALDIHRDLSVSLSGDVNGKRKITGNGITADVTTQGTTTLAQTEVWLKSKGRPVSKPKPAPSATPIPTLAPTPN